MDVSFNVCAGGVKNSDLSETGCTQEISKSKTRKVFQVKNQILRKQFKLDEKQLNYLLDT